MANSGSYNPLNKAQAAANIMKCFVGLENVDLEKAEGSRGGKIIGHTKSGKAIYENKKGGEYKNFDENDHKDAEHVHHSAYLKLADKHGGWQTSNSTANTPEQIKAYHHRSMGVSHAKLQNGAN